MAGAVRAQSRGVAYADLESGDLDQALRGEFVKNAGEVLVGEAQARGDDPFSRGQRHVGAPPAVPRA